MKIKCEMCRKDKGRRICRQYEDKIICSLCCAKINNKECEGCQYLEEIREYRLAKIKKSSEKHFIAEINPEIENIVGQAMAIVKEGDIEKAQDILIDLKNKHLRENYMIYYGLGVVCAIKANHDEAIRYFEKSIKIFPYCAEAHFNMGIAYQKKSDIKNAVKSFREVLSIDKSESYAVKQSQEFIKKVEQSVKENNDIDLETYFEANDIFDHAFACMERKEWEKALGGFKTVLTKNKRHVQSYGNMGICYGYLGQKEEAIACFDKAIEIDPTYKLAISNRRITESLKEGETLNKFKFKSVEYYSDRAIKKKLLVQSLFQKLIKGISKNLIKSRRY